MVLDRTTQQQTLKQERPRLIAERSNRACTEAEHEVVKTVLQGSEYLTSSLPPSPMTMYTGAHLSICSHGILLSPAAVARDPSAIMCSGMTAAFLVTLLSAGKHVKHKSNVAAGRGKGMRQHREDGHGRSKKRTTSL